MKRYILVYYATNEKPKRYIEVSGQNYPQCNVTEDKSKATHFFSVREAQDFINKNLADVSPEELGIVEK